MITLTCLQIEALQLRSDGDPATRQLVKLLQNQMQEVQQQISTIGTEVPACRPSSGVRPKTAGPKAPGLVTSALQVCVNEDILVIKPVVEIKGNRCKKPCWFNAYQTKITPYFSTRSVHSSGCRSLLNYCRFKHKKIDNEKCDAFQGNLRPSKNVLADEEDYAGEATNLAMATTSENKPLNAAMSKQAILKEVRKQKDDYRKQIR